MMMKVSPERKDLYIQMLLDNLCRINDENNFMADEIIQMREQVKLLFQENSVLRGLLESRGLEVPISLVNVKETEEIQVSK